MAGSGSDLIDVEDDGVLVTVGADFVDFLSVPRSGAFVPNFLAGTGVVNSFAEFEGHFEGFLIHVGEHEGIFGLGIDGHGGG